MFKRGQPANHQPVIQPDSLPAASAGEYAIRGWAYYAGGNYPKAENDLREALRLEPDDVDTTYALGLVLKAAGQGPQAVEVFRQTATLAEYMEDRVRSRMVRRLALGQIHEIESGEWNLEKETWQTKR